jgi:hypothetical protein
MTSGTRSPCLRPGSSIGSRLGSFFLTALRVAMVRLLFFEFLFVLWMKQTKPLYPAHAVGFRGMSCSSSTEPKVVSFKGSNQKEERGHSQYQGET